VCRLQRRCTHQHGECVAAQDLDVLRP
jgi:hypothetical protein